MSCLKLREKCASAIWFAIVLGFPWSMLHADDIKLASGEVLHEVEVLERKPDSLKIRLLDGKTRTLKMSEIAEHVEKKTVGQEFDEKAAGLKSKADLAKMIELAKWGLEKGARIHAVKLLNKVLNIDRHHEEANLLLGNEKVDGKWLSGKDLENHKMKLEEAQKLAEGMVKVDGKWVDAFSARQIKAGLIEHEGTWYTKDDHKKASAGMIFRDGQWYAKDAREKLDQNMRMEGGKWIDMREQNAAHKDILKNPWLVESLHFRIRGTTSYERLQKALVSLEQLWPQLLAMFKDGPAATVPDKRLTLMIGIEVKDYTALAGAVRRGDDRESFQSSNYPVFYSQVDRVAATYYMNDTTYLQWLRHGAVWAYLGGFTDTTKLKSPMIEAFAAYFECTTEGTGRYVAQGPVWDKLQNLNWSSPRKVFSEWKIEDRQNGMAKLGFLMYFLKTKYPEDLKAWVPKFLNNGASFAELLDPIEKRVGNDLTDELNEFYKAYVKK